MWIFVILVLIVILFVVKIVVVFELLFWEFKVWCFGVLMIYFFSVFGGMYNIICKMLFFM